MSNDEKNNIIEKLFINKDVEHKHVEEPENDKQTDTESDTDDETISDFSSSDDDTISDSSDSDTSDSEGQNIDKEYILLFNSCMNEIKQECKRGGFITIGHEELFKHVLDSYFIDSSMYYNYYKKVYKNTFKVGDVVKDERKYLKHYKFYQVVKIKKNTIKCKALHPCLLIKQDLTGSSDGDKTKEKQLFKYTKGIYSEHIKDKYYNKSRFSNVYKFDVYIFDFVKY